MRTALVFAAALPLYASAALATAQPGLSLQEMYKACTTMAATQPQETRARAEKWYAESKQPAALHCLALAQFELKDYTGAAASLDQLLTTLTAQNELWLNMKKQAVMAHRQAQNGEGADRHLSDILRYLSDQGRDNEMVPLLLDRARIYAARGENLRAVQDLDHALSIQPAIPIVLERARVYLNMGDFKTAETDIRRVLKSDALNEEASKMLGELERRQNALKAANSPAAAKQQEDVEKAEQDKQARELEALERQYRNQMKGR